MGTTDLFEEVADQLDDAFAFVFCHRLEEQHHPAPRQQSICVAVCLFFALWALRFSSRGESDVGGWAQGAAVLMHDY